MTYSELLYSSHITFYIGCLPIITCHIKIEPRANHSENIDESHSLIPPMIVW